MPQLNIKNLSALDYILVTRYIEHNFSQNECLNFNLSSFDFLENRKGIESVSKSLFNKSVENLKPIEVAEVFALYEKPLKNNRNRNPANAKKRTEQLYQLYLKNSNN
ncbi:transglycosylase domain-containing protein [Chryseobacterium formosense]|nr:transglycosylase domain-containing protein [Chryseobacterium formosense]